VLAGRCHEREQVPFKTLDTLIDALTTALLKLDPDELTALLPRDIGALARLFPVLRRVPAIAEPALRRFHAIDPRRPAGVRSRRCATCSASSRRASRWWSTSTICSGATPTAPASSAI
jgi:hypothetical protein